MATSHRTASSIARLAAGFTLFEVLVTLAIITAWLFATAGVQSVSAKLNKAAQFRSEAVFLASEMAERIEANKDAAGNPTNPAYPAYNGYAISCPPTVPAKLCTSASCNGSEVATFDKYEWASRACAALPGATGALTFNGGAPPTYTITIGWNDRRDDRTYSTTGTVEAMSTVVTKSIFIDPD